MVNVGEEVYGGQQIAKLYPAGDSTHLHFGISNNGTYENPLPHVKAVKNKITSPVSKERAKQQHDSLSQTPGSQSASFAIPPSPQQNPLGLSIGAGGFNINGRQIQKTQRQTPQIASPPVMQRPTLATYPSYDSRSQAGQVIPFPITIPQQQQPQMMQQESSAPMMMGPSEEQLLNSFYKRVLLNTLQ
jgi:hypothetical protein